MSDPVVAQALEAISTRISEVREDVRDMRQELRKLAGQVPTTQALARLNSCMSGQCPNKVQEVPAARSWLDRPIVLPLALIAVNVILVVVLTAAFTGRKGSDLMPADLTKAAKSDTSHKEALP